jgi:hypothetical protein
VVSPLTCRYREDIKLAGILYFHRISDNRMSGTPVKNFKMFRKLCGDSALRNVVIVTNMWEDVRPQVGEAREAELMKKGIFFKPALDRGARMARHENTVPSAESIIRLILNRNPLPLHIQKELVDDGKDISETRAGQELNRELADQIKKHKDEIRVIKEEMQQAIDDLDEETRREREDEARVMQKEVERLENDARRFASDFRRQKKELEVRVAEEKEKAKRDAERLATQYQEEIDELYAAMRANTVASDEERAELLNRINELARRRDSLRVNPGILSIPLAIASVPLLAGVSPVAGGVILGASILFSILGAIQRSSSH